MSTKNETKVDAFHGQGGDYIIDPKTGERVPDPAWLKFKADEEARVAREKAEKDKGAAPAAAPTTTRGSR